MNLTQLPDEILIKIFEYCKVLPLTHVSSKFNLLISNSPVLMRKLNLVITEKTKYDQVMKSVRKHQKILFKFNYQINDSVLDLLKTFSEVKYLEFMRCILFDSIFIEILKVLPKLVQLSIYSTYLKSDQSFTEQGTLLNLSKLKELNFRNSDQKIINLLKQSSCSIKRVNISLPHQYPISTIIEFISIHDQIESIENLTVAEIEDSIFTHLLCKLENLKRLSLEAESVKVESIRDLMIENKTIEHLNLYGRTYNPGDLNIILSFFKNLKSLELEVNSTLEPINFIHLRNTASEIESLKIKNCYGDFFNHITFSNLKYFELSDITIVATQEDWTNFARRNPELRILKIKDESITNEIFINICNQFRNLKDFELFYDPQRLTNDILDFITSDLFPRNIKTLKIYQRNRQQNSFFILTTNHKHLLKNNSNLHLILR